MNCKAYFQYCKHFNWQKKTYDGMTVDELAAYIQSRIDGTCEDADEVSTGDRFLELHHAKLRRAESPDEIGYYLMHCLMKVGYCDGFIENPNAPECVLKWLARHYDYCNQICLWLPDCPQVGWKFRELLAERSADARSSVAGSKLTQVPLLLHLAEKYSDDTAVRRSLIDNPNTPDKIIKKLKRIEANKAK